MATPIDRYPPGVGALRLEGPRPINAEATWEGVSIGTGQHPAERIQITSRQARELGEWLLNAANRIDQEG
jgi:hypothetical protein